MKNFLLAILALLTAFCLPEGTSAQVIDLDGGTTRAVVVGISDYQDKDIPDLRFADRTLKAMRNTQNFKDLMQQYFPTQYKN